MKKLLCNPVRVKLLLYLQKLNCLYGLNMNINRFGALNLFAAFDTRTRFVWGQTHERKRQEEFILFLEDLDREIPFHVTKIHIVLDNLRRPLGKKVQAWAGVASSLCVSPSPCPLFKGSIKSSSGSAFFNVNVLPLLMHADKKALAQRLQAFIAEWNAQAHPFNWTSKSVAKVMAKCSGSQPTLAMGA